MLEGIDLLQEASDRMISMVSMDFRRYLCSRVNWDNRLICLKGAKGTGKTTLVRQHIKETFANSEAAFYLTLDHLWFTAHDPLSLIDGLYKNGVTNFFIDEVHHFHHWQLLIKNIYDLYPDVQVVYSGSSILRLDNQQGDLSRRQIEYELNGLSFREFIALESGVNHSSVSLEDVLTNHRELAAEITDGIKILPLFRKYLQNGFYPFYKEAASGYDERLIESVNKVLECDLPVVEDITPETIRKTKKMLAVLAETCPQTPKMAALYRQLETDRNQGVKMLNILERAGFINRIASHKDSLKNLSWPEKLYCNNTNIMHSLVAIPNIGTQRETFFVNQLLAAGHDLKCPASGDFLIDDRWLVEVGGKGKGFDQIADIPESFVAADDIEIGRGNKIPLWLFGFLY